MFNTGLVKKVSCCKLLVLGPKIPLDIIKTLCHNVSQAIKYIDTNVVKIDLFI